MFAFLINRLRLPLMLCSLIVAVVGCGGGGGKSGSPFLSSSSFETPPDDTEKLMIFEGETRQVASDFNATDIQWQQIGGVPITMAGLSDSDVTVTMPWLIDGPAVVELQVNATVDGKAVEKHVEITILDRRYLAMRVRNEDTDATNLYLDYISANDDEYVPEVSIIQLSDLPNGAAICEYAISPSGQYIAYSISHPDGMVLIPTCRGVYVVDIENQTTQKLSKIGLDGQEVISDSLRWSPDGFKIAYRGDHGEGVIQIYNIDVAEATTSYINYDDNTLAQAQWPATDLYPIDDGGNPYISVIEDPKNYGITWLNNSNGFAFQVRDTDTSDTYPYLASRYGDARKLDQNVFILDYIAALDEDAQSAYWSQVTDCPDCPDWEWESCAVILPVALITEPVIREYVNPYKMESSVDGRLMFVAKMIANIGGSYNIVAVTDPVVPNEDAVQNTPIEAIDVFDAAWSPTSVDLAFSSGGTTRHYHIEDENVPLGQLVASEIPGQLYLYQNYQHGHSQPQERLAYPRPDIDDNWVRELKWSNDGNYIAYARGTTEEGNFYTSLWVTLVDDVRDESEDTINANTVLLANFSDTTSYVTDFMWSPDNKGVLAMLETDDGTRLRYVSRDGSVSFDSPILTDVSSPFLFAAGTAFSPDGQYYAYVDEETTLGGDKPTVYIQSVAGGDRVKVNVELQPGETIEKRIRWSPHGDAVLYTINRIGDPGFYLAKVNGVNQNLNELFLPSEHLLYTRVK